MLEAARRTLEEESRYSREIPPAYIAGPALNPETAKSRFKGRWDIFREIETVALSPQPPVLLLYGGRRSDELDDYWSDYLINTRSLRLTYLREEEARELIEKPVEGFPDIYQPEAVARIVELSRCQPFLVQLLCYALVEELNRKAAGADPRATKATAADVEAIVPKALETGGCISGSYGA